MPKRNIESLLRLYADHHNFCNMPANSTAQNTDLNDELSENELDLIAAAAHAPLPAEEKNKK